MPENLPISEFKCICNGYPSKNERCPFWGQVFTFYKDAEKIKEEYEKEVDQ